MKFLKQLREQDFRGSGKYNSSNAPDFRGGRKSRQDHNNEAYPNKYPENRQWSRHDDPRARAVDMINQAVEDNEDRFELIGDPDSLIKYLKGKHHDFSPDLEQLVRDIIGEEVGNEEPDYSEEQEEKNSMWGYKDQDLWAGASLNAPVQRKSKRAKRVYDKQLRRNVRRHEYHNEEEELSDMDMDGQMVELQKRFEAARRGIGITNRLRPGPDRTKHRRRVMSNLNSIRAQLNKVIKQFEQFGSAEKDYATGRGHAQGDSVMSYDEPLGRAQRPQPRLRGY